MTPFFSTDSMAKRTDRAIGFVKIRGCIEVRGCEEVLKHTKRRMVGPTKNVSYLTFLAILTKRCCKAE